MIKTFIFYLLVFISIQSISYAQECPRILRSGDTLYTDPAEAYQWYKNGEILPDATFRFFLPDEYANYSVWVKDHSTPMAVKVNKIKIEGKVFDDILQPVSNATCTCKGQSVVTDTDGQFTFDLFPSGRISIQCKKNGFLNSTFSFKPISSATQHVKIKMQPREVTKVINSSQGGFIRNHFGMVHLRPNSIADADGNLYEGEVFVHFKQFSPEEEWFGLNMPGGDFMALDENNDEVILYSYGFIQAELTTPQGEPLNIAERQTAKLYSLIVPEQLESAPDSIPLWYFDEEKSYWFQEGWAYRESNTYVGEVSHFSAWNWDWKGPRATIKGKVVGICNNNNEPIGGAPVHLSNYVVYTDQNGKFESWCAATIPFDVIIGDTIIPIPALTEGEIYELSEVVDSLYVLPMIAYSRLNEDNTLITFVTGSESPYEYSIDGTNYQMNNYFSVNPSDIPCVYIKDQCNNILRACDVLIMSDCNVLDSTELINAPYTYGINSILNAFVKGNTINKLNLNSSSLDEFPIDVVLTGKCLQHLKCNFNDITNLPLEIGLLENLELFSISSNLLTELPPEIGLLYNLQVLNCYSNQLTSMPPEISQLDQLHTIYYSANQLTELPPEIGQLNNLIQLYCSENQLTSVRIEIGFLTNLEYLELRDNQLTSLPSAVGNLKENLNILDLQYNNFTQEEMDKVEIWLPNTEIKW